MKKKFLYYFIFLFQCCVTFSCYAYSQTDVNHTLHIYLKNKTQQYLKFENVFDSNPGNNFIVEPKIIRPEEIIHITAEKNFTNDMVAHLIFVNANNDESSLFIWDQEQIHMGKPVFNLSGSKNYSVLISKKRNPNVGSRYLTYIEAVLEVRERRVD